MFIEGLIKLGVEDFSELGRRTLELEVIRIGLLEQRLLILRKLQLLRHARRLRRPDRRFVFGVTFIIREICYFTILIIRSDHRDRLTFFLHNWRNVSLVRILVFDLLVALSLIRLNVHIVPFNTILFKVIV